MSESTYAAPEVKFTDGTKLTSLLSWTHMMEFTDPMGLFEFTVAATDQESTERLRQLTLPGELVIFSLGGKPQATNIVVEQSAEDGDEGVIFSVTTESLLTTPYEGDVDPDIAKRFKADTPISAIINQVLKPYSLVNVSVAAAEDVSAMTGRAIGGGKNNVVVDELKQKEVQARDGEQAFEFLARLFGRLGVQLRMDHDGLPLLTRPNYNQDMAYSVIAGEGSTIDGTRILANPKMKVRKSNRGLYSHYLVRGKKLDKDGQTRAGEPYSFLEVPDAILDPDAPFQKLKRTRLPVNRANYRPGIAGYKPKFWRDDEALDQKHCDHKAFMMHGTRASSGFEVTCSVDGVVAHSGHLWTYDTVVRVYAPRHGLDEEMWVRRVERSGDKSGGQLTTLTIIPKGALVLGPDG